MKWKDLKRVSNAYTWAMYNLQEDHVVGDVLSYHISSCISKFINATLGCEDYWSEYGTMTEHGFICDRMFSLVSGSLEDGLKKRDVVEELKRLANL